jgi:hypothetical protein
MISPLVLAEVPGVSMSPNGLMEMTRRVVLRTRGGLSARNLFPNCSSAYPSNLNSKSVVSPRQQIDESQF